MAVENLGPLDWRIPIVTPEGRPTAEFQRRWEIQIGNDGEIEGPADPTAIGKDTAVPGTATTYMRSDAAPAIQKATSAQFGLVKVDGTTITETGGVISSSASGGYRVEQDLGGLSTYTFSSIPSGFDEINLYVEGGTTQAALNTVLNVTANGLSTAIYSVQRSYSQSGTNSADQGLLVTSAQIVALPGANVTSGARGFLDLTIFNYDGSLRKVGKFRARQPNNATTMNAFQLVGTIDWGILAAITSITVAPAAGNFATGTFAILKARN